MPERTIAEIDAVIRQWEPVHRFWCGAAACACLGCYGAMRLTEDEVARWKAAYPDEPTGDDLDPYLNDDAAKRGRSWWDGLTPKLQAFYTAHPSSKQVALARIGGRLPSRTSRLGRGTNAGA